MWPMRLHGPHGVCENGYSCLVKFGSRNQSRDKNMTHRFGKVFTGLAVSLAMLVPGA